MNKILISACLLGKRVRYDGRALTVSEEILKRWIDEGRVVSVCPEVDSGMSIPRAPAEIVGGNGVEVLAKTAIVVDNTGVEVTDHFTRGAEIALSMCQKEHILVALLAESSPSCGSSTVYDGSFSRTKIAGTGVTAALLEQHGIEVFSQYEIALADLFLKSREDRIRL
jgi:uncharacterized protein YbbK (DUF523 family)